MQISKRLYWPMCCFVALLCLNTNLVGQITFEPILRGLSTPVDIRYAPGDPDRLYVVLREGEIRVYDLVNKTLNPEPFLTIPNVQTGGEAGLLSLAFHPNFQFNGFFYVNYNDAIDIDSRIVRYTATDSDIADPTSALQVIRIEQSGLHNGGWLGFARDGYLFVSTGDGFISNNSQQITNNLNGKILRIDIDTDHFPGDPERNYGIPATNPFVGIGGDDEIFAFGLRNPWRCSIDRVTGDLWIGDVGAGTVEEVSFIHANSLGGQNFGWPYREGTRGFQPPGGSIDPIFDYLQGTGQNNGMSISGGYVYRGPIKGLRGNYFFSDFIAGRIRSFQFDGTPNELDFYGFNYHSYKNWNTDTLYTNNFDTINNPTAFGEDFDGNLYVCDFDGDVFKLVDVVNQIPETLAISAGVSVNGGLSELMASDDLKLVVQGKRNPICSFVIEGTSPTGSPGLMSFTLEASTRSPQAGVMQIIEFFNYDTLRYETIDSRQARVLGDQDTTASAPATLLGSLSKYVEPGTRRIKARVTMRNNHLASDIRGFFDQAFWTITNR